MQLPGPVRAVVGLLANAADEAKHLPDRAIELPMLAVSTALQVSLRAQQRYARLAARGDEVLNRRAPGEDPPAWATFDDAPPAGLLDDLIAAGEAEQAIEATEQLAEVHELTPTTETPPETSAATAAKKGAAKKAAAAKKSAPAKRAAPTVRAATVRATADKQVNKPRHADPSPFDAVDD
jgi:hypothetical protein